MAKLDSVDDTLETLGTPKLHRQICTWSRRMIIGGIIYLLTVQSYDVYWWFTHTQNIFLAFLIPSILNHTLHLNLLIDSSFIFFLWYVQCTKYVSYLENLINVKFLYLYSLIQISILCCK